MYKHSKKFRERYNMKAYIQAIGAMMDIDNGIGYKRFKSKEEARKAVLRAISRYKPKFSDYLAELRSHSKVNQYVCVISEHSKKGDYIPNVEENMEKTIAEVRKRYAWLNTTRESDAEKQRKAVETGQIDKIINCDSVGTYVPQPKRSSQNG
jgi:hypothetical protein